ncbi:hypothetical protein DMENIID0001_031650 [Sergentomyia squamirostris]
MKSFTLAFIAICMIVVLIQSTEGNDARRQHRELHQQGVEGGRGRSHGFQAAGGPGGPPGGPPGPPPPPGAQAGPPGPHGQPPMPPKKPGKGHSSEETGSTPAASA